MVTEVQDSELATKILNATQSVINKDIAVACLQLQDIVEYATRIESLGDTLMAMFYLQHFYDGVLNNKYNLSDADKATVEDCFNSVFNTVH